MTIEHDDREAVARTDDLDYYRSRTIQLEDIVTGVHAVIGVDEPDWRRRCRDAADALRRLLALPDDRPGAWEAEHVHALDDPLRDILQTLDGEDDR